MNRKLFYIPGNNRALTYAGQFLKKYGCRFADSPGADVTHLLLPVPSRESEAEIQAILEKLPADITVIGGNLHLPEARRTVDLLLDDQYLAENAAITADCALRVMVQQLPVTLFGLPVLILGWGRIGKCLAQLLRAVGCRVTVGARKEADRAIAAALGYDTAAIDGIASRLAGFRVIFNTVPHLILREAQLIHCRPDCIKIELASSPGIGGCDVINARGLPGKMAPEASGNLIARSILRVCFEKEAEI